MSAENTTATIPKSEGLQVYRVTSTTATDARLKSIMKLSAQVFAAQPSDPNTHTSFDYWRSRLQHPHSEIIYIARSAESETPLGFFFNYPRTHSDTHGDIDTLHIWLAGVDEEARGLGIFPMLMEETKKHARSWDYDFMTVRTIPKTFVKMYRILCANGWEEVEFEDSDFGRRVLLKYKL